MTKLNAVICQFDAEKKYQKKRRASAHVPRFSNLVKPFNQICLVNCPFDLWKGHILTPCCFKRSLTPGCNLMECMPTTEKGQQVTRVTLKCPRGKWPLDMGPSASVAAETHKCCSSAGSGDGCEPKKRRSLFENEAWNTYLYCICIKRGCFLQKGCVQNLHVCAAVCTRTCGCALHIYHGWKSKSELFFFPSPCNILLKNMKNEQLYKTKNSFIIINFVWNERLRIIYHF